MKILIVASTGDVTKIEKIWWSLKRVQHQVSMSPLEKLDTVILPKSPEDLYLVFDGSGGLENSITACRKIRATFPDALIFTLTERQGKELSSFLAADVDGLLLWPQDEALIPIHISLLEKNRAKLNATASVPMMLSGLPDLVLQVNQRGVLLEYHMSPWEEPPFYADKFVGRLIGDALAGVAPQIFTAMGQARENNALQLLELEIPSKKGQQKWLEARITPLPKGDFLIVLRDISSRKHREVELTLQLTMLEEARSVVQSQADLLAAQTDDLVKARDSAFDITRMLAIRGKDTQDSLQKVLAFCEEAFWETPSDTMTGILEKIRNEAQDLLRFFDGLIDFAMAQAHSLQLRKVNFEVERYIRHICQPYVNRAQAKGLDFQWNVHNNVPKLLEGDPERLKRVLEHLIENAIRCTATGGVLLEVMLESENQALFGVADTGPGIEEERLQALFESAENLLGLPLCAKLIESMGGKMWGESEVGKGSQFCFTLPFTPN